MISWCVSYGEQSHYLDDCRLLDCFARMIAWLYQTDKSNTWIVLNEAVSMHRHWATIQRLTVVLTSVNEKNCRIGLISFYWRGRVVFLADKQLHNRQEMKIIEGSNCSRAQYNAFCIAVASIVRKNDIQRENWFIFSFYWVDGDFDFSCTIFNKRFHSCVFSQFCRHGFSPTPTTSSFNAKQVSNWINATIWLLLNFFFRTKKGK